MKPRILFINSVCGFGSTGRIVADLSKSEDYDSFICYGRNKDFANVNSYKFANFFDNAFGAIGTILFNNNLNICSIATKRLIKKIKEFNPDIIHIHNIHGYYLNVEMLFKFLKEFNKPVVWTLHDCWSFTGYCPFYDYIECEKFKGECKKCPYGFSYPFSFFKQGLTKDFYKKKELFNSINNLTLVTPSTWLKDVVKTSILKDVNVEVINNGIELKDFKPSKEKNKKFTVLAVSNYWTKAKGIDEFNKMMSLIDNDIDVVTVGNFSNKIEGSKAIEHTNSKKELVDLYSSAHLFVTPTLQDNYPTVNIEALACGTPVVSYNTGGSSEIYDEKTGITVKRHDYKKMAKVINSQKENYTFSSKDCVERSAKFSKENMIENYKKLYESLLAK